MQNKDKTLRVGIAGYGIVGKRRRNFIDLHPDTQTVAVCDRSFGSNGTLEDGVKFYANYKDLLAGEKLDIVYVCMTNDIAAEVTIACLERGIHVFCEKPPGRDIQDICNVVQAHKKFPHLKLKYGFNHRYHDSVRDALRIVRTQELGRVVNLRGVYGKSQMVPFNGPDWRIKRELAGGGILLDQGIHMVDLMRLFAGEFEDVHSFVSNDFWHYDVEDNAYALMKTRSGIVAMLHSSATQWRHRFHLEVSLEHGAINLTGILSGTKSYGEEKITVSYRGPNDNGLPKEQTTHYNADNSWRDEIHEFTDCVLKDLPVEEGSDIEALRTMHLVYRIYGADPKWRETYQIKDTIPKGVLP